MKTLVKLVPGMLLSATGLILTLLLFTTSGCSEKSKEIENLLNEKTSLISNGNQKDSVIAEFLNAFNEIQSNLDSIKMKEKIIARASVGRSEVMAKAKDQINSDIRLIYKLQSENRKLISVLRSKLRKSDNHASELERMLENMSRQLDERDLQIAELKDNLDKAHVAVTDLTTRVDDLNVNLNQANLANTLQQQVIDEKVAELNTAYYVIGTADYLKKNNIVTREGGIIGLGASKELSPQVDNKSLTKVDITQLTAIPIMKHKVSVLTTHPSGSYRLTGENQSDSLIITNQKDFWSLSKVLVLNVR